MANSRIQIKYSTANTRPADGTLTRAELGYSYVSNTFFIGTSDGAGVIAVGGKYYLDQINLAFSQANAAFSQANSAGGGGAAAAGAAFDQANTARTQANTAFAQANIVFGQANAAFSQANIVFAQANTAYNMANSANVLAFNTGIGANAYAQQVGAAANTFAAATYLARAGGTVSGDLVIQGNLVTSGVMTYANTQQLFIGDAILTLNSDIPNTLAPSENAGIEINRGNAANVSVRWNEGTDVWEFTNDGTTFTGIGSSAVDTAAFTQANTARNQANTAFAQANLVFGQANAAFNAANTANTNLSNAGNLTTGTVPAGRLNGSYTGITGVGTLTAGTWNASTILVTFGGTGQTSLTNNAVMIGNGQSPVKFASSSTEGHVLQINAQGVPFFDILDGGTF